MSEKSRPFLRLIEKQVAAEPDRKSLSKPKRRRPIQLGLPFVSANTVVFCDAERATSGQFYELLTLLKPRWIVDARSTPRFDILLGSRQFAFRAFAELAAIYVDLFGELGIATTCVVDVNPSLWSGKLAERIKR